MPDKTKTALGADDAAEDLARLKRAELDKLAADAGVPNPDELANKDEVIAAIEAPNPALAPVPDPEPGERTWKVIGPHKVHDTAPGATFTADLPAAQAALLIESGHILEEKG